MNNKHIILIGMTFFFWLAIVYISGKHYEKMKQLEIDFSLIAQKIAIDTQEITQTLEKLDTKTKKHW